MAKTYRAVQVSKPARLEVAQRELGGGPPPAARQADRVARPRCGRPRPGLGPAVFRFP
jgi:hypothetical protein